MAYAVGVGCGVGCRVGGEVFDTGDLFAEAGHGAGHEGRWVGEE